VRLAHKLTASASSESRLSRKCGSIDVLQPCGPPRPVTGIALFLNGSGYELVENLDAIEYYVFFSRVYIIILKVRISDLGCSDLEGNKKRD
jgi:hypothetical protein